MESLLESNLESWKDFHATSEKLNSCLKLGGKFKYGTCEDDLPPCAPGPSCAMFVELQSNFFTGVTTTNSFCNPIVVLAGGKTDAYFARMQVLT